MTCDCIIIFFFSSRRRHTRCALVTGVQTCALPISTGAITKSPAPTFGPEQSYTTEIGFKSEFFNRRARLNVAVFNTEYNSIQLTFQNGSSPVTANGGDGRIRGVEAELNQIGRAHV